MMHLKCSEDLGKTTNNRVPHYLKNRPIDFQQYSIDCLESGFIIIHNIISMTIRYNVLVNS